MDEDTLYCTCCNANKPAEWFDGNEKSANGKYKTCERCRQKWGNWRDKNRPPKRMYDPDLEVTHKVCIACNHGRSPAQPISNFGHNRRNPDGYSDVCFKCQHRRNALRRQEYAQEKHGNGDKKQASKYGALTPNEVLTLLASGGIRDQTPGYWMRDEDEGKPPCWREVRDYKRAWERIMAPEKPTEPTEKPLPPRRNVGTTLLTPANLDIHKAPTDKASALRQLEMFAALAG